MMKKRFLLALGLLALMVPVFSAQAPQVEKERVLAMCAPSVGQIKNIVDLYEKDIISLRRLKLVCIFHENELTDYTPAFEYVKSEKLTWVSFEKITGPVEPADLFRENPWTPQFRRIFEASDGIIFTGGMDIPPALYGEENSLLTDASTPIRTTYEVSFLFHLVGGNRNPGFIPFLEAREDYPVLAICLGAQTLNVAAGGTLIQDIPSEVYGLKTMEQVLRSGPGQIHSALYYKSLHAAVGDLPPAFHPIAFKKGSMFVKRMAMDGSDRPYVLTSHHQAVKKLGQDLWVSAVSLDGKIVEALEHRKYPNVLGVQFHPEPYALYRKGLYYRETAGGELGLNLRSFLIDRPPSMTFHRHLWAWFSGCLLAKN